MNHDEATQTMAVEKYLLGELPPAVRDDFEEHLFDCLECAADLTATAAFLGAAKGQLGNPPLAQSASALRRTTAGASSKSAWWELLFRPAVASPVFALLLLVIGYQGFTLRARSPAEVSAVGAAQVLPSLSLVNARGGAGAAIEAPAGQPFLLQFDIPGGDSYAGYTCELLGPSGDPLYDVPVTLEQAKDTVSIHVPGGARPAGSYTLIVRGKSADGAVHDVTRYTFTLTGAS